MTDQELTNYHHYRQFSLVFALLLLITLFAFCYLDGAFLRACDQLKTHGLTSEGCGQ